MNNFKKKRGYLYNLRYEMEVASLFNTCIVSSCEEKLFRLKKRKAVRDAKSAVASILLLKEEEFPVVLFMMLSVKNTSPLRLPYKCPMFSWTHSPKELLISFVGRRKWGIVGVNKPVWPAFKGEGEGETNHDGN